MNGEMKAEEKSKEIRGGRNLVILGAVAAVLSVVFSAISLSIYHATGDIYLDRSRPGFISEDEKGDNDTRPEKTYAFPADGEMTDEVVDEYLKELDKVTKDIVDAAGAFSEDALSDEALGIDGAAGGE